MKQIFNNRFVKSFGFSSYREATAFIENQKYIKILNLDDSYGDKYYFYFCFDSLQQETYFILSFESDFQEEDLNFLFWDTANLYVLDTGNNVFLIDKALNIISSYETTILIGLYLTNNDYLLILEEFSMILINKVGQLLKRVNTGFIEDFKIKDDKLYIKTENENKVIELF